jgi:hypothetical protein
MPKKHEPKKREKKERKDSPHFWRIAKRERGMTLEYTKTQKYFTLLHNLDQSI